MKCTGSLIEDLSMALNDADETDYPLQTGENIINWKCVKQLIVALKGTRY